MNDKNTKVAQATHSMVPSRVGHGTLQCSHCTATDLEIAHSIGPVCSKAPVEDAAPARLTMFLEILQAMGGTSDASDYHGNWIKAFCEEHEGRSKDTFNTAADGGYTTVSHDSDTDESKVTITEKGRSLLEGAIALPDPRRSALIDHLEQELTGMYDCTRVWSAWSVGTMTENDFVDAGDRVEEIADGILDALDKA